MKITQAQRKRAKIKLAIQGCSGSGKTNFFRPFSNQMSESILCISV